MKPSFKDHCRHDRPLDRFLGTIPETPRNVKYDLYIYQDNALADPPDLHLCFRYGDYVSAYTSPGNVEKFLKQWGDGKGVDCPAEYRAAIPLIKEYLTDRSPTEPSS